MSGPQPHSRQPQRKRTFPSRPFRTFDEGQARREPTAADRNPAAGFGIRRSHDRARKSFGGSDPELWTRAEREGRTVITKDLDFSDGRRFTPGTHHGVVLVRLHAPSRLPLIQRWKKCFRLKRSASGRGVLSSSPIKKSACDGSQTILKLRNPAASPGEAGQQSKQDACPTRKRLLSRPHRRDHQRTGGSFLGVAFVVLIEQRESAFAGCGCSSKFRS